MKSVRIIIFAKAPVAGLAKTRLIPALGEQGAANLAKKLLQHTVMQAHCTDVGIVELCVTPSLHHEVWNELSIPKSIEWSEQGEGDLGARMASAASLANLRGESVLLIGTDCPSLTADVLRRAVHALDTHDSVLVPAFDGGYVLLGLNKFDPSLFFNMTWSVNTVAQETRRRIHDLAWSLKLLNMLHDIDNPEDLQQLPVSCEWDLHDSAS